MVPLLRDVRHEFTTKLGHVVGKGSDDCVKPRRSFKFEDRGKVESQDGVLSLKIEEKWKAKTEF